MNFINSLNQKEAPREEVPLFCLQSESRTALKPFRSFSSDNHRPSGLVRIPIICKLKNSGTILVCHLTRIGGEKSAHCLTGITGQHSTFLLFDAIVTHLQIIHPTSLLQSGQCRQEIFRSLRILNSHRPGHLDELPVTSMPVYEETIEFVGNHN